MNKSLRSKDMPVKIHIFYNNEYQTLNFYAWTMDNQNDRIDVGNFKNDEPNDLLLLYEFLWDTYFNYSDEGKTVLFELIDNDYISNQDFLELVARINRAYGCHQSAIMNFEEVLRIAYERKD